MTDQEEFEALWKDAFAEYEKETNRKLNKDDLLRRLKSTDDLLEQIESEGRAFRDWRSKHNKLWSAISTFLKPVTALGNAAQGAIGFTPWAPASGVLGAILYLIKAAEEVSNAYDWVEQVFAELREFSDRLVQYAKTEMDSALRRKVVAILSFILQIIGRSEFLIKKDRFREYLRVTFMGKDEKTKALLDELNKSMKNEQSYVLAVTYSSAKTTEEIAGRTEKRVEKTSDDVQQIAETVEALSNAAKDSKNKEAQREDEETLRRTLDNTSATRDVEENYSTYRRNLLKGSGAWLQKETLFNTWIDKKAPILWVFGGPGAGKSYLSTWTIMRLMEIHDQHPEHPTGDSVAFFYIKENKEILRDPNIILKALAWQITLVDPVFRKHAAEVCKSTKNTITAEDTWENLFLDFYRSTRARDRSAILVLDGLDEAAHAARMTLLTFMKNLVNVAPGKSRARIQFAVFGRATLRGDMAFSREEKYIEVSPIKNHADIDSYIQKRLEEVELLKELQKVRPNGPQQANKTGRRIKKKVLDGADGVFLWAKLLLDQIIRKDLTQIEKILANPPSNLDEMIWSVFDRLSKDQDMDHESVRKMLAWVAFARRPLLFGEIDLILSLPSRRPNFLLWKSLQGRFASIFNLKFPKDYDPEDDGNETVEVNQDESEKDETNVQEDEVPSFDFTGDDEEDEDEDDYALDDTGVIAVEADHGLERLATGDSPEGRRDTLHMFSDGQLKTIVTFSHQRIRDYLVREGTPKSRSMPYMDTYPNVQRAQIDITITCLAILRLGLAFKRETRYLVDYPAKNFVFHLENIDKKLVTKEDKQQILDGLFWLFHDESGARSLFLATGDGEDDGTDTFWHTWLATNHHSKVVRDWFHEVDTVASISATEAGAWMQTASTTTKELFKPLAKVAATIWLKKPGYDSDEYLDKSEFLVWVLYGYLALDDDGIIREDLRDFPVYLSGFWDLGSEKLVDLAEWAQLEQTTHWHTGLGWILMEGQFYEEAISHFQKALELDSDAWVAKEGIARSLGEQGFYEEAIKWMEEALEALPERLNWLAGYLYPRVSLWKRETGDHDGAFEAAKRAYDAEKFSPLAQLRFLEALDAAGSVETIIQVVQELDIWYAADKDYSFFVRFIMLGYNAFAEIGKACRAQGKPEFVLDAMTKALSLTDQSNDEHMQIWLPAHIASFRYDYYDQVEEPMQQWELALKRIAAKDSTMQKRYTTLRKTYSNNLGQLYFDAAVAAHKAGSDPSKYAAKLKGLSVITETSMDDDDGFDFYSTGYPSMLWGRWLRDYQGAEEVVWRKCFKARLLEEMDMLDDDDPSNDTQGLHALAVTLFEAGDRINAGAILAILFKPLEDEPINEPEVDQDSDGEVKDEDSPWEDVSNPAEEADSIADHAVMSEEEASSDTSETAQTTEERAGGPEEQLESTEDIPQTKGEPPQSKEEAPPKTEEIENAAPSYDAETRPAASPTDAIPTVTPPPSSRPLTPVKRTPTGLPLQLNDSWMYTCDACGRDAQDAGTMYFCEICLNKNYCGDCVPKVRDYSLSLPQRQCHPDHEFYQAWPIPADARDMAALWFGGEVELRREWLEALRAEWMR